MTDVTAIVGTIGEIIGEGIDLDWTITIGGVVQDSEAILLPTKVSYEVNALTPLGDQEFKIENVDGDYSVYTNPFVVTDSMRIITVYQPSPWVSSTGKHYGDTTNYETGGWVSADSVTFKIYGVEFDPACVVTIQKSSQADHPQNYLAGGDNTAIYTATQNSNSPTEIMCTAYVADIPVTHNISIGGDKFGVMYYDVTVTNPNGDTFTEKASAYPGAYSSTLGSNSDYSWDTSVFEAGHGLRIWNYDLGLHVRISDIIFSGGNAWTINGEAFENDSVNQTTVVTLMNTAGIGPVYSPQLTPWGGGNTTSIEIINGAIDVNTGLTPPVGVYDVTVTNLDGSYDTAVASLTIT